MTIEILRGPWSTGDQVQVATQVDVSPLGARSHYRETVRLRFILPAGGRGRSEISVEIAPASFARIAQAMMNIDEIASRKAFGAALVAGPEMTEDTFDD